MRKMTVGGLMFSGSLALFGAATCVSPMSILWRSGQTLSGAMALVEDPAVLSLSYAAAGAGWLLAELTPVLVRILLEASAMAKSARLRAARAQLEAEWRLPGD